MTTFEGLMIAVVCCKIFAPALLLIAMSMAGGSSSRGRRRR